MKTPVITINEDKACRECGEKGATDGGLCLKCINKNLAKEYKSRMDHTPIIGFTNVAGVSLTPKTVKVNDVEQPYTVIQFMVPQDEEAVARMLYHSHAHNRMNVYFQVPEAQYDLFTKRIEIATGVEQSSIPASRIQARLFDESTEK